MKIDENRGKILEIHDETCQTGPFSGLRGGLVGTSAGQVPAGERGAGAILRAPQPRPRGLRAGPGSSGWEPVGDPMPRSS